MSRGLSRDWAVGEGTVRVQVDRIATAGEEVVVDGTKEWAVTAATQALESAPTVLSGTLELNRDGRKVHVGGKIKAVRIRACDRCGQPVSQSIEAKPDLVYYPAPGNPTDEAELMVEELDIGWFEKGALDLTSVLSETLALSLPNRTLCEDTEACDLRTNALFKSEAGDSAGHPGFAALEQMFKT
jgi:uncharacterized metal-binding protein YceD (DUF177 family)